MLQDHPVPQVNSLDKIYSELEVPNQIKRYESIVDKFIQHYGIKPTFLVRAPGRVNIIGEHIDYCGYGVLPMGIEKDIVIACHSSPSTSPNLHLASTLPSKYPSAIIPYLGLNDGIVNIDITNHSYTNYPLAGFKGIIEAYKLNEVSELKCMIDGTVPSGGGLSSSSALVVAMSLATAKANQINIKQKELASLCVKAERYVGVNGGGMDQACSILSIKDQALFIEFVPTLSAKPIQLNLFNPESCVFVIANSMVVSDKAVSAKVGYNLRVVETRLAGQLLSLKLGLNLIYPSLRQVMDSYFEKEDNRIIGLNEDDLTINKLTKMSELVDLHLDIEPYNLDLYQQQSKLSLSEIEDTFLNKFPIQANHFYLNQRAKHVFTESKRVILTKTINSDHPIKELGELMNQSQRSCKDLFDCSHPDLDNLVDICLKYGALGSRLSGAGWGGCTISLVPQVKLYSFIQGLREEFYQHVTDDQFKELVFQTSPGTGACTLDQWS